MSKLMVGAAKVSIDPTPDMYPFPPKKCDWGISDFSPEEAYDEMDCRAIAIDNGQSRILILSYELGSVPDCPDLAQRISEETGVPKEDVIITATHNHTCARPYKMFGKYLPGLTPKELEFDKKNTQIHIESGIRAAKEAVDSMRPARYGDGECPSFINTNRDLKTPFGYWVEARNLQGYSDKTLAIIKFVDSEGRLIAALLNHGTHATCAYLMKDADGKAKTSGNFNGIACKFAEEHYGNHAVVMWTSGAAGNQNPLLSHGLQYEYPDGYSTSVSYPDGVGFMQMEFIGRTHGADAVKGIDAIAEYQDALPIVHLRKSILLPTQKEKGGESGRPPIYRPGGNGLRKDDSPPKLPDYPQMEDDVAHPAKLKMQLLMLGDIAVILANAELYAQLGRDIKEASPYKKTFVITHSDVSIGYILDKSSKEEKVFQAFSPVKPGSADEAIVDCEMALFEELLDKQQEQ